MREIYDRIREELQQLEPRKDHIEVPREAIGDPKVSWTRSIGWPHLDTRRQWRDGTLHIHETRRGTYRIHRDEVDPHDSPLGHLLRDSPATLVGMAMVAGLALTGAALKRR